MATADHRDPTFEITHSAPPSNAVVAGIANPGFAGLTAADFLVDALDLEQTGYITVDQLPEITPFEEGVPRHHTRLFSRDDVDLTVLTGELFVPQYASTPFTDAVTEWMEATGVAEVAMLNGVPVAHGPDDHRTFYVATDDYRRARLADADVPPMPNGYLDGVNGSLLSRGIDSPLAAGVLVTPVHSPAPDVEAAIRLVDTVETIYDVTVDTAPLDTLASEIERHYQELAERIETMHEDEHRPEDRMYM